MKHRKRAATAAKKIDPVDKGANGMAYRMRPFGIVQRDDHRLFYNGYQDAHLIDRMLDCRQLTKLQHAAAQRVLEMHADAGFEPKVCGGYAPIGWATGHDDDLEEIAAITRFRKLLGASSEAAAMLLHALCLEQHPGTARLASLWAALDDLVKRWGME